MIRRALVAGMAIMLPGCAGIYLYPGEEAFECRKPAK